MTIWQSNFLRFTFFLQNIDKIWKQKNYHVVSEEPQNPDRDGFVIASSLDDVQPT